MPLIAVVNDDTAFLHLMEEALREEGYRVLLHLTTDGALDKLVAESPDLIILDIVMEQRDAGLRLLRAVRGHPTLAHLPVIVSSADLTFLHEHAEELASLRSEIIEKPFDLDRLFARIAAMTRCSGGEAGAA